MDPCPNRQLSEAQQRAAELLALGEADVDVARQLDRHAQTIRRWKKNPEVAQAITAAGERVDANIRERMYVFNAKLIEAKLKAIEALTGKLLHQDPAIVLKSAETLLKV